MWSNADRLVLLLLLLPQDRDPRWLVEPRTDGTNVNGWHWQDKNRFTWAKARLEQALPELPPAQTGNLRISKVTDVVGEVRLL